MWLSGWQRLGILISAAWLVGVCALALIELPQAQDPEADLAFYDLPRYDPLDFGSSHFKLVADPSLAAKLEQAPGAAPAPTDEYDLLPDVVVVDAPRRGIGAVAQPVAAPTLPQALQIEMSEAQVFDVQPHSAATARVGRGMGVDMEPSTAAPEAAAIDYDAIFADAPRANQEFASATFFGLCVSRLPHCGSAYSVSVGRFAGLELGSSPA